MGPRARGRARGDDAVDVPGARTATTTTTTREEDDESDADATARARPTAMKSSTARADSLRAPSEDDVALAYDVLDPKSRGFFTARDGSLRRLSAARLEITIPAAPTFELSAPETLRLVVPAAAVLSRAAPRMALDALILRPAQGSATLAAPGLATEVVVRAGGVVVDDGYGGEFVDTPPALNVTLEMGLHPEDFNASGVAAGALPL